MKQGKSFPRNFLGWFVVFSALLSSMASMRIYTLHSSFMDLGVFEWNFWNIAFNDQWQRAFWGHVQPLMLIIAAGYKIFQNSYFLVFVQSILLAVPLLLLPKIIVVQSRATRGSIQQSETNALIPLLTYTLFFPVWYNALFDFHMDHIAVPLGFLFYLACFKKRWGWAVVTGTALSLIKEPFALMTFGCGMYILCKQLVDGAGERRAEKIVLYLVGCFLVVFGLFYFYIAVNFISPMFTHGARCGLDAPAYSWLGSSITEMAFHIMSHPLKILVEIFGTPRKIIYLAAVFGSLAFIPLLSPLEIIPALPVLAISMLSRLDNYYGLGHHYTAGLIAPVVVAFIGGLPKAIRLAEKMGLSQRVFCFSLIAVMLTSIILISPSPISRLFWINKIWNYGYSAYLPDERSRMITEAVKKYIPSDPYVAVATQNNLHLSYLAKREVYLPFPVSVLEPHSLPDWDHPGRTKQVLADYIVLDLKRPLYLIDKGCDWQYGRCRDEAFVKRFMDTVEKTKKKFFPVYENDDFFILKRYK